MIKAITTFAIAAVAMGNDKFAEGSQSRDLMKIHGHTSAVFTPVNAQGEIDTTNLPKLAARLQEWGCANVMVGGTTGESLSFTHEERLLVVKAWLAIADQYKLNVYVHTGMDSV